MRPPSFAALEAHPKLGASWEGFALEEVLRVTGERKALFWNGQGGAGLDLLLFVDGQRFGFEFKYTDAPAVTKSLNVARADLKLKRAFIVHPGRKSYPLNEWTEAIAIGDLKSRVEKLAQDFNAKA